MSEVRALIDRLVQAGIDPIDAAEIITRAAIAGVAEAGRSAGAVRQQRYRERHKASQSVTGDASNAPPPPSPDKKAPHTPKELTPSAPASSHARGDFDRFWARFPNKVGKADALKAFARAAQRVDIETMMAGLDRYVRKTDDRPWCNPATWLNQDRWDDQPANVVPLARGSPGLSMNDFLGTVIDQQERRNAAADTEIEGYPPPARFVR